MTGWMGTGGSDEAGDDASACPVNPCIIIDTFPFEHSGDTSNSPLDQFDSYDDASDLGEAGSEVV